MKKILLGLVAAVGLTIGLSMSAEAAPVGYVPCLDQAGQGFSGLACTAGVGETYNGVTLVNAGGLDSPTQVNAVLKYVFGDPNFSVAFAKKLDGNDDEENGFDTTPDDFSNVWTVDVKLDDTFTFATLKAAQYMIIFDIRGLTEFTLTTDDFIENCPGKKVFPNCNPTDISHISFWGREEGEDPGPDPNEEIPAPAGMALLGLGLLGLAARRRGRA